MEAVAGTVVNEQSQFVLHRLVKTHGLEVKPKANGSVGRAGRREFFLKQIVEGDAAGGKTMGGGVHVNHGVAGRVVEPHAGVVVRGQRHEAALAHRDGRGDLDVVGGRAKS